MRRAALAAWFIAVLAALAGCASTDPYARAPIAKHLQRDDTIGECARFFRKVDQAIDAAGVRDAQAPRVAGFPYLRVDRLTAGLAPAPTATDAQRAWRERLAALDREARAIELVNAGGAIGGNAAVSLLDNCRDSLADADRAAPDLAVVAKVDDDYSLAMRTLGIYPLTKFAFAAGIRRWHEETVSTHALPLAELPRLGTAVRYVPKPPLLLATGEQAPPAPDALGVPRLSPALTEALLARHAPALEVDTVDADDRLGQLTWGEGGARVVADTTRPAAYGRIAFTRFAGRWVPQLVYTFWFPARPAQGSFDALAGHLDGVVWRVTLGADLKPLAYDTIHPCGCYHQFYPTPRVRDRPGPLPGVGDYDETLFVPQRVDAPRDGERQILFVAARTHYLRRVATIVDGAAGAAGVQYALRDDNELRVLPWPNESAPRGTRSAYGPDALVAGSERLERFFFWPMGIESAGQMRQWGHHATAFVGRRHFDDPDLFDKYFEPTDPALADPR